MTFNSLSYYVIKIISHEMIRNEIDFGLNDFQFIIISCDKDNFT